MKPLLKTNRSKRDPTNQAGNRQRANRDNNRRLKRAEKIILAMWSDVTILSVEEIQVNAKFYRYSDAPEYSSIQRILDQELETETNLIPFAWYFKDYDERAFRSGVFQENNLIWIILAAEAGLISNEVLVTTPFYIAALSSIQTNDYRLIQNLARTTSNQIFQVIQDGIDGGLSRSAIRQNIIRRFEVARSASERIVRTEINRAYNNARLDLAEFYISSGQLLAVVHISAFLPTTRSWHAARHGQAYSPEAQRRWWDSNSNRINCYCSIRSARTDENGDIVDTQSQQRLISQGETFFS